jgi:CheY-like chemotaxis protein
MMQNMPLAQKRIFVIEDNIENLAIMQVYLKRNGAISQFERWGTGIEERIARFAPIDLVLLDLNLPLGVSGYEVFDILRDLPATQTVPVMAVTAADPYIEVPRTQEKGFAGFISKPIRQATFIEYIVAVLEGKPVWPI